VQQTRRYILDILKIRGEASVDEIVESLHRYRGKDITAVTVRHHLIRLKDEGLVASPELRHRDSPGRPQHLYSLTEQAIAQFPNNYQRFAAHLLEGLQAHLPAEGVNVILEDVANHMAEEAEIQPDLPFEDRLDMAVDYLSSRGYEAYWEYQDQDSAYLLHTSNCPYHHLASDNPALCDMDMRLVASLLGVIPRRHSHMMAGESDCAYLVRQ
jgi:predicted ArsR family transcriptional regulator